MQLSLQKLTDRHYIIMCLLASGRFTQVEIAQKIGVTREYVWQLTTSPLFKAELDVIRARMRENVMSEAVDTLFAEANASVRKLIEVRDDPNTGKHVQMRAATELLDRNPATAKWHKGAQAPLADPTLTDDQIALLTSTFQMDPLAQSALANARKVLEDAEHALDTETSIVEPTAQSNPGPVCEPSATAPTTLASHATYGNNETVNLFDISDDLGV